MAVRAIPEGFHSVTPYLVVKDVTRVIDFLRRTFDARELTRSTRSDGTVKHAEVRIGDSIVMMGEASDEFRPMPAMLYVYVADADATYQRALAAGATSVREPRTEFYGDRSGGVQDHAGNQWWMATHVEDVSPAEMARREAAQKE